MQLGSVGCSGWMPALLSPSNPWVAVASMERVRPVQPPGRGHSPGALTFLAPWGTFTAFLVGVELIPPLVSKQC